jgi:hypothetical protein
MAVGEKISNQLPGNVRAKKTISLLKQKLFAFFGFGPSFYSGSRDNSYECFSRHELRQAKDMYVENIRMISEEGILAIAFNDTPGFHSYIKPYVEWLRKQNIFLSEANYFPFYSVYALIFGSTGRDLFRDQNVLVVTSLNNEKEELLTKELMRRGARLVQFYGVSPSKAMFDRIDLGRIAQPVNVVLVGAGVGACSILNQLKPLNALTIDAGFAIDALAFPEKRWNRPYCIPDWEFDPNKVAFV